MFAYKCILAVCGHNHPTMINNHSLLFLIAQTKPSKQSQLSSCFGFRPHPRVLCPVLAYFHPQPVVCYSPFSPWSSSCIITMATFTQQQNTVVNPVFCVLNMVYFHTQYDYLWQLHPVTELALIHFQDSQAFLENRRCVNRTGLDN